MDKIIVTKEMVVEEARTWLGTPFKHQGRLKGVGVDCLGVVSCVARDLDILHYDVKGYGRIPEGEKMRTLLRELMEVVKFSQRQIGDVGLFSFASDPQHLAFFTDKGILHSFQRAGKCMEQKMPENTSMKLVEVYRFRNLHG